MGGVDVSEKQGAASGKGGDPCAVQAEGGVAQTTRQPRLRATNADDFLAHCDRGLGSALQPLYTLETGALYGFEALSRGWRAMGFVSAHELFDHADRLGVLCELEARQIESAVARFAEWRGEGTPILFVNLDSRILTDPSGLLDRAKRAMANSGLGVERLCFELSERHDKTRCLEIERNIARIRGLGFQIGLDDFGAGVSDIKALYKYDLNFLKIDRFFINGVAADHRKRFFVASIVELAHLLGQKIVVEGVETAEDLAVCRQLRCDIGQGFGLATPQKSFVHAPARIPVAERAPSTALAEGESLEPYVEFLPPLPHCTPMVDVLKLFARPEAPAHFPVVGDRNEPLGLVRESGLRSLVHSPFGRSLVRNPGAGIRLAQYLSNCPTVDAGVDVARLAQLFAHDGVEGVIVTSEMRYMGFLPAAKLLQLNAARQLRAAREANPLTHLGGNGVVADFIRAAVEKTNVDRIFCYLDFDNFKPFNDHYGFALGDRAILLFSTLLRKAFEGGEYVLGHIGGDDFFAGAEAVEIGRFQLKLREVLEQFRHEAESLYAVEDRAAGGIRALDRDGRERVFPLLTCSAGVLHAPVGCSFQSEQVGSAVASLKRSAKNSTEGVAYMRLPSADEEPRARRHVCSGGEEAECFVLSGN